ncbi:MAG: DNA-directed RNA polymerase subunit alpha C-terminal domain-containing protein [Lachnospiraceae bacterium]
MLISYYVQNIRVELVMKMAETPIEVLKLSVRANNALHRMNVHTIETLMETPIADVADQRQLGAKTLAEINDKIQQLMAGEIELNNYVSDEFESIQEDSVPIIPNDILDELAFHKIDELQLAIRAHNALLNAGFSSISDVLRLSKREIADLKGLGEKSKKEILEKTKDWLSKRAYLHSDNDFELTLCKEEEEYYKRLAIMIKPLWRIYWRKLYSYIENADEKEQILHGGFNEVSTGNLEALFKLPKMRLLIRELFLSLTDNTGIINELNLRSLLSMRGIEFDYQIIMDVFQDDSMYWQNGDFYFLNKPSILDWIEQADAAQRDKKEFIIFTKRLRGEGLQEIGDQMGLTRERIRQISQKMARKLPGMQEDYLSQAFSLFRFSKEAYIKTFVHSSPEGYEYLSLKLRKGAMELNKVNLNNYQGPYVGRMLKFLDEFEILQDRRTVTKMQMVYRVLISTGNTYESIEHFEKNYYQYIDNKAYPRERLEQNTRTLTNVLRNAKHIVFNKDGFFRYSEADEKIIWSNIDFNRYKDSVISSDLIFREHKELMEELDIRDGYELFCVIKTSLENWNKKQQGYEIICRRIPVMVLGKGSEQKQILRLLKELSPISCSDYYEAYEERYGVRKESVQANLSSYLDIYNLDGMFSIDVPNIDELDVQAFTQELNKKDFWYIDELEELFLRICTNSSLDSLNSAAFSRLNYTLNAGYAYSNVYNSVSDYFKRKIFSREIIDLSELDNRLLRLPVFYSFLQKEKLTLSFVESAPKILLSMRSLFEQYAISEKDILEFQSQLSALYVERYFNAYSLWEQIKHLNIVERMNSNEWLCNSILRQQEGIYSLAISGTVILSRNSELLNLANICGWIVSKQGRMSVHQLTTCFNELFGASVQYYRVAEKIKATDMWGDLVTDSIDDYIDTLLDSTDFDVDDLFQEEFF